MASEDDTDFQRLAEYGADVICRSGVDMKWRYVSPSSFDVLGWTPEEMKGMEATLALTDGLTELANRRAFDEALDREWKRTLREGSQISLLLLDLDCFKEFNDHYGHQVGDDCLRAVARAVAGVVRATDIAARYGGEEIAVILPSTNTGGSVEVAEKVRSAVEALQITHEGNPEGGGWVTVSVGVATALSRQGGSVKGEGSGCVLPE